MLEQNIPLLTDNLIQQIATNIYEKQKGNSKTEQVDNKNYKYNYLNETSLKTFYNKHQNLTQTNETIRQVAPKTAKKQGLVEEKPKVKNKNSIMTYKNDLNPINENENFYTDFNYIVKKDYFELKGQGKKIKASPEFDNEINKLYKEFDENFTFNKATVTDNVTYKNATKPIAVTLEYTNNKSEQKKTFLNTDYKKLFKGYSFEVSNEVHNGIPIIKVTDNGETVGYVVSFVPDENKIKTDHIDQTDDMVKTAEKSEEEKQLKTKKGTDTPFSEELKEIQKTKKYKNLSDNLQQAIDYVFEHSPIYNVTGKEFPNNGENLNERVYQYYKDNFDNKVSSSEIGEIKLDKRSIKDSIYHGTNENKMNAFVAVPYVIKKGRMIDVTKENNNGENRYLFIAPISLKGEKYFCEVVVKSNKDRQGFYLHEVELTKKLADVFSTAQHGTSTSSKSIIANLINNLNPNVKNSEQTNKIDDVGEFLKGNRKQDTSLSWTDLESMNDLVRAKNTTKAKIYPKPTLEELKSEGYSDFGASLIINVYNKINSKPASRYTGKENQKRKFKRVFI